MNNGHLQKTDTNRTLIQGCPLNGRCTVIHMHMLRLGIHAYRDCMEIENGVIYIALHCLCRKFPVFYSRILQKFFTV